MARTSSGEYMAAEYITLAQKIINDVDNILRKYPNLMSFEIVPVVTNNQNKSPVLHYEGCLGLEQWCIKQLYTYCYNSIFEKFIFDSKSKYKLTSIIADNVLKLLNVALLINPDVNTFWNVRRDLVVSGSLNLLKELHFTKLVLSRKAKSNETFGYRRWIIEYLLQDDNTQNHFNINRLVAQDMEITENAAQLCPNNYHSWNHRTWFVNKLCSIPNINIIDLHVNEYVRSEKWCSTHISDHSCFHYRQNCIRHICNLNNNSYLSLIEEKLTISYKTILLNFINEYVDLECSENVHFLDEYKLLCSILDSDVDKNSFKNSANSMLMNLYVLFRELLLNNELIIYYKGHETLWYHRRFIIRTILSTLSDYFFSVNTCINQNKRQRKVVCDALVSQTLVFKIIVNHESKYVKERTEDGDNYSERHKKYLKYIEDLQMFSISNRSSSSSDSSSECHSQESDLIKFNRMLISSVTRRWSQFRRNKLPHKVRGRSLSDFGLSEFVNTEVQPSSIRSRIKCYADVIHSHDEFGNCKHRSHNNIPQLYITSAGAELEGYEINSNTDIKNKHLLLPPSTGNFNCSVVNAPSGLNGTTHGSGGNQVPRSEPSTPLQIDPASLIGQKVNNNNSSSKLDRNAVKQLSGSAASVAGGGAAESGDSETKAPSKARQKKFLRHFPQVGPDERVLNYYSCALVGDILLQGHLYITKNYFAFYSNVFGYVTKLLIPTASVVRVEKERLARIIPNAVGVSTSAERHVFGSLLSRDATYRLMTHVVKVRKRDAPELEPVTPPEIVPEASEYSDSSCSEVPPDVEEMKDSLSVTSSNTNNGPGPVIQPALLLGATVAGVADYDSSRGKGAAFAKIIAILLALSATALALMLFAQTRYVDMPIQRSVGEQYAAISYARRSAHANAARDLQRGLHAHLQLMHEVRKSLETLTSLIASDLADASSQDQNGKIVFGANSIESDELR